MNFKKILILLCKVFLSLGFVLILVCFGGFMFYSGYVSGLNYGLGQLNVGFVDMPQPTPKTVVVEKTREIVVREEHNLGWSGPELWAAVNDKRSELGVGVLGQRSDLCTIASIRLNELLSLGELDGHEGFSNMAERRPDLEYIFEKYNMSEFLVQGASSAQEAVDLWLNTLGHSKLLTGGEYVWGCTYAQEGFGVAIAAY